MTALILFAVAAGGWAGAALTGLLSPARGIMLRGGCAVSVLGGAAALAGGVAALLSADSPVLSPGGSPVVGTLQLQATSLSGVFAILLGVVAIGIGLYLPRSQKSASPGTAVYLCAYNLALLASLAVLAAGGVLTFLVAWESMALLCYALILHRPRSTDVAGGAFWFLALSEAGFVLIVAAFAILATQTHTMDLGLIAARAHLVPGAWRDAAYLLALAGFGFKAGVVPLHVWLPAAHPVAPADGSAFLSGVITKLGVYGIALFGFRLLPGAAWTGIVTMAIGALTAAIGILYALGERDIKRFLAFSTIENVGIIVTAFGAAMTFLAYGQRALWAFLLLAGLYHVLNHGCYKTLLFLEAGVTEHAAGTRDMDRLGGLARLMPRSGVIAFVGTLGIAALPPLNGFVSEWLIFQGLFQGFRTGSHLVAILIVLAAGTLGLTGGLAIYAFVRGYGIPYLGMPRTRQAAAASERGQPVAGPGAARNRVRGARGRRSVAAGRAGSGDTDRDRRGAAPGAAAGQTDRDPRAPRFLRVLAHVPGRVPGGGDDRAGADLPGRAAPRFLGRGAGLGRRDAGVPAAHAVLGDDVLGADAGHLRRPVPAVGVRAAGVG